MSGAECMIKEGNDPLFMVYIGMHSEGKKYSRLVYGFLNMVAVLGGLLSGLMRGFKLLT